MRDYEKFGSWPSEVMLEMNESMRKLTEGVETGAYSSRIQRGYLVTDVEEILCLWT